MSGTNGRDSSNGSVTIVLLKGKATRGRVEGEKNEIRRCVPTARIEDCDTWSDAKQVLQRELVLPLNESQCVSGNAVESKKAVVLHVAGYRKPREFVECLCGCLHLINCLRCCASGMGARSSEESTVIRVCTGTKEYELADFMVSLKQQASHKGTAIHFAVSSSNNVVMQVQSLDADAGVLNAEEFYATVQNFAAHELKQVQDDEEYNSEALHSAMRDLLEAIGRPDDEDLYSTVQALIGDDSPIKVARPRVLELDEEAEETKGGVKGMLAQVCQRALDTASLNELELEDGTPLDRLAGLGPRKIEMLKSVGITSVEKLSLINIIRDCDRLKSAFNNKRAGRALKRLLKYREQAKRYVQTMLQHDADEVTFLLAVEDDEATDAESYFNDAT